jgi:Holliday junction resolvase RusA-like endonuclease
MKINELPERYQKQVARQIGVPGQAANVESHTCHAPLPAKKAPRFDGQVVIRVIEHRHRLADPDGACVKYLLDAIVSAGLLQDDSQRFVHKVEKEQVKIAANQEEKTIVEIWGMG